MMNFIWYILGWRLVKLQFTKGEQSLTLTMWTRGGIADDKVATDWFVQTAETLYRNGWVQKI